MTQTDWVFRTWNGRNVHSIQKNLFQGSVERVKNGFNLALESGQAERLSAQGREASTEPVWRVKVRKQWLETGLDCGVESSKSVQKIGGQRNGGQIQIRCAKDSRIACTVRNIPSIIMDNTDIIAVIACVCGRDLIVIKLSLRRAKGHVENDRRPQVPQLPQLGSC